MRLIDTPKKHLTSEERGRHMLCKQRKRKRQRIQYNRAFRYKNRNINILDEAVPYPVTNRQIDFDW